MVKSLFDICMSTVCQNRLDDQLAYLPSVCKQRLLEFFSSHDKLFMGNCLRLVSSHAFGSNITRLNFYLSDQLTDDILTTIADYNRGLEEIAIIDCRNITDLGILAITTGQDCLRKLELRALAMLTSYGIGSICSYFLHTVDLSSCPLITSEGIHRLVYFNRNIRCLYLNHCKGIVSVKRRSVCDDGLYYIAKYLGENLTVLELDFLPNLSDPSTTLFHLCQNCPNIKQLSLCRFFEAETAFDEFSDYRIEGLGLRDVDLYGNYFLTLPMLPPTVKRIRLSVCGDENVNDLISKLRSLPQLNSIRLQLTCRDQSYRTMENANRFLCSFIPYMGAKITSLQISIPRLVDTALRLITQCLPNLDHLALDVRHMNNKLLRRFFSGGACQPGSRLTTLKLCRLRITYRALFAIARGATSIMDLETSYMPCVDDRFLVLLADNCKRLCNVNFNGCKFVSDKGLAALARSCCLKEVRIRATSCTDKSIYILAQFCPDLEWISHADFSGRPKFSDKALQCLRDSCIQRVIC
uniref:F-box/LRR-repeat protein 7 n=1 Tax=Syphacia muris TaxID=451379 RepID=A0A0N5AJB2_9BILA